MRAGRVFCVIAVLACLLLGTVTAYADGGHGAGHSFGNWIPYRVSCHPNGIGEEFQNLTDETGAYGGIVWLSDITPTSVSAVASYNPAQAPGYYYTRYDIFLPSAPSDHWDPCFGIVLDVPIGYDVEVQLISIPEVIDWDANWLRVSDTIYPNAMTYYRHDGTSYVCSDVGSVRVCVVPSVGLSTQDGYYITASVRVKRHAYTEYQPDDVGDVADRLDYPFSLDGVPTVMDYMGQISNTGLVSHLIYGAVFLMLAAMVVKMMM